MNDPGTDRATYPIGLFVSEGDQFRRSRRRDQRPARSTGDTLTFPRRIGSRENVAGPGRPFRVTRENVLLVLIRLDYLEWAHHSRSRLSSSSPRRGMSRSATAHQRRRESHQGIISGARNGSHAFPRVRSVEEILFCATPARPANAFIMEFATWSRTGCARDPARA